MVYLEVARIYRTVSRARRGRSWTVVIGLATFEAHIVIREIWNNRAARCGAGIAVFSSLNFGAAQLSRVFVQVVGAISVSMR